MANSMKNADVFLFALRALIGAPMRTALICIAMAIGVASVILLTSMGEGARGYIQQQFSALGTHLLILLPGRSETTGGAPPLMGTTPRDLTLDDAKAIAHSPYVVAMAPLVVGSAPVSWQEKEREVTILGSSYGLLQVRHLHVAQGSFLPQIELEQALPVCVLGDKLQQELFGTVRSLGKTVRIADYRCKIIGVLEKGGVSLGVDLGEVLIMPVASAQMIFNTESLFRIMLELPSKESLDKARSHIQSIIRKRHEGDDDITIISQDALLATFNDILRVVTLTLFSIASISLLVAGVMIMNVMLVTVSQRTAEIGLLTALGSSRLQILQLFLAESALLSLLGSIAGMFIGLSLAQLIALRFPEFPIHTPIWAVLLALCVAIVTGVLFGLLPAARASRLDPVKALHS